MPEEKDNLTLTIRLHDPKEKKDVNLLRLMGSSASAARRFAVVEG